MRVFVLLFNARTENEGIHTLKMDDRNVVLMFESEDDATRYGILLEAQDFSNPTVEAFETEEIEEFCDSANYECKLVPEGMLAVPPETNVEEPDWNPEGQPASSGDPADEAEMPPSELERLRRRFEGLL
ncbi:MAG: DUF3110 domain-containing protein [Drouetiella hepatica Uher 2000/2452]|jgi:hypothetical protein|uniref:DUF3110 domain-containing protein n=1 Tax=Drouetiella hepatica Uher 2000/2452 TaxID=904376 RepID=A0A951UMS6_9CYAN|nr:DUF3110 domain-containing protein [Drouetiella hepatica Uher 2000/2452]